MALYNARGNLNVSTDSGWGLFTADGELRITIVPGTSRTGLYAANGGYNVVITSASDANTGLYHACGALRVVESTSAVGVFAPNGGFYVSGAARSIILMGTDTDGLTLASIDDTMTIRSTSDTNDNYQGVPNSKLTTTRASTAAYWTSAGLLAYAAPNELRRDFDPRLSGTTELCGYLIEEARTNSVLQSQTFGTTWTQSRATITSDAIAAPDGTTTADKLVEDATAANDHRVFQAVTTTAAAWTFSVYAKAGERTWLGLRMDDSEGVGRYGYFNLATGAVGTPGTGITQAIVSCGNGWYRCSVTIATAFAGSSNPLISIGEADGDVTFDGDGASGLYIWGAQCELGAFATSYIPTAGSTVTRAADLVTLAGTLFPLNQSEGTLYAKFVCMGAGANPAYMLQLDNNANGNETITLARRSDRKLESVIFDNGSVQAQFTSVAAAADLSTYRSTVGYKLNDSAVAQAGETVQSDNVCTMPTTTHLGFGGRSYGAGRELNGWLFEAAYFPTRKSNSQLQYLQSGYASDALLLMGAETQGLTFSATDQSMSILDTTTAANNYTGELSEKLGSIRTSSALTTLPNGLLGFGPENLVLRSQEFDNAAWNKQGTGAGVAPVVTANAATAPDGTLTADKIDFVMGSGASSDLSIIQQAIGTGVNMVTCSVYLRADAPVSIVFRNPDNIGIYSTINVTTQWQRFTLTGTPTSSGFSNLQFGLRFGITGAGSASVYAWGAQMERASSASTYKPTASAAYYGLRLDYDSRLIGGPGYLIEESRTNLALQSQDFSNAAWPASSTTISANAVAAPDGRTTADLLYPSTTGTDRAIRQDYTKAGSALQYAFSVYVKANTWQHVLVQIQNGGNGAGKWFDLTGIAAGTTRTFGAGFTLDSSSIQDVGNGWRRCTVVVTTDTNTAFSSTIVLADADNSTTATTSGTNGIYLWGGQVELGAFATSYIPTTTATVTRAADSPIQLGTTFPLSQTEGTLVSRWMMMGTGANDQYVMSIGDGTNQEYIAIIRKNTTKANLNIVDGGATQVDLNSSGNVSNLAFSGQAAAYKVHDCAVVQNGESVQTDGAATMPTTTQLYYGNGLTSNRALNGWLRHGRYFPTRKSNEDLAVLSAAA